MKYGFLAVLVIGLPLAAFVARGYGAPFFCELICPAGTLEAGIPLVLAGPALRGAAGGLFLWKLAVLAVIMILSVFCFRVFCRFLCPLGAFYGIFNRWALFSPQIRKTACVHCGECVNKCKMDTLTVNDRECIHCGKCIGECPGHALGRQFSKRNF